MKPHFFGCSWELGPSIQKEREPAILIGRKGVKTADNLPKTNALSAIFFPLPFSTPFLWNARMRQNGQVKKITYGIL
jgi:hypothetical protein